MTADDTPRMTPAELGEALDRIRNAMPSLEEDAQRVGLAMEVILTFLGPDWLAAHMIGDGPPPFLRDWRLTTGDPEAFVALQRIVSLGSVLYCLQDVPGFDDELREVWSNQIRGAWYELWVANRFMRHGLPMSFRPRSGVKGQDYEFDVEVGGLPVSIEAKACDPRPHADFRATTVTNLLQKAARQLPKSGLSVIFVGVLWPHGRGPDVRRRAVEAAKNWLRNQSEPRGKRTGEERAVPTQQSGRPIGEDTAVSSGGQTHRRLVQGNPKTESGLANICCPLCREPATAVVRMPEVPDALLCRTCRVMPSRPDLVFPPLYIDLALPEGSR